MKNSKKLSGIHNEKFNAIQPYFRDANVNNARMKFKIRMHMIENIPGNFSNKFNAIKSMCSFCKVTLTQEHLIHCQGRVELRKGLNMKDINDLVTYFSRFLEDTNSKPKNTHSNGDAT